MAPENYWQWVHKPVPGAPRFFQSSFLEHCTKTPWWVVPALWARFGWPQRCAPWLQRALQRPGQPGRFCGGTASLAGPGVSATASCSQADRTANACNCCSRSDASEQVVRARYAIHRCLFHARPCGYWPTTLHFGFHGCHHKFPADAARLVFPPLPAAGYRGVTVGCCSCTAAKREHPSKDMLPAVPSSIGCRAKRAAVLCVNAALY